MNAYEDLQSVTAPQRNSNGTEPAAGGMTVTWPGTVAGGRIATPPAVTPSPTPTPEANDALYRWWMAKANDDYRRALRGLREYSSADLLIMGDAMRRIGATPDRSMPITDTRSGVLGAIGFYVLGKVSRWLGALREGQQVSADTLLDVVTYAMMARFVQEHGEWSTAAVQRMAADEEVARG